MNDPAAKEQVRKLLETLHRSAADDAELRALLAALDQDIHRTLAQPAPAAGEGADLGDRARAIAARFAARHPRLEPLVEELVNLLAGVGL